MVLCVYCVFEGDESKEIETIEVYKKICSDIHNKMLLFLVVV